MRYLCFYLTSSMGYVFINDYPISDFVMRLKQGDPSSTFLFILDIEDVHITFVEGNFHNLFKGLKMY